ncbi:MAG: hypothetical protein H7Y11_10750, partial [Armatimonadetes bacterium]|nr:hypothetical protein [Anaerolineae bacterium]
MPDQPDARTVLLQAAQLPTPAPRSVRQWFRRRLNSSGSPSFNAQSTPDPHQFMPSDEGSGVFGKWVIDDYGLPAYDYTLDQNADPRAAYPNTQNIDRRDHWHQIGNQRLTALASNDGVIQVYSGDRGGVFLNRFEAWTYKRPSNIGCALAWTRLRLALMALASLIWRRITAPATIAPPIPTPPPPRGQPEPEALTQQAMQAAGFSAQSAAPPQTAQDPLAVPHTYAGGYSYVDDGGDVWATAYRYRPFGAKTKRRFGISGAQYTMEHRQVRTVRTVYAPYGDAPTLLVDVELYNQGLTPLTVRHYEYWDVNVHQLTLSWLRTGDDALVSDQERRALNNQFTPGVAYLPEAAALRFSQTARQPRPLDTPDEVDWSPAHIFLADLSGTPDAFYVDKARFFGTGGALQPDAVVQRRPGDTEINLIGALPYCLVLRRDITLQPGEHRQLRYA